MTEDIVTRLTALNHPDAADAADEIERLRADDQPERWGVRQRHDDTSSQYWVMRKSTLGVWSDVASCDDEETAGWLCDMLNKAEGM